MAPRPPARATSLTPTRALGATGVSVGGPVAAPDTGPRRVRPLAAWVAPPDRAGAQPALVPTAAGRCQAIESALLQRPGDRDARRQAARRTRSTSINPTQPDPTWPNLAQLDPPSPSASARQAEPSVIEGLGGLPSSSRPRPRVSRKAAVFVQRQFRLRREIPEAVGCVREGLRWMPGPNRQSAIVNRQCAPFAPRADQGRGCLAKQPCSCSVSSASRPARGALSVSKGGCGARYPRPQAPSEKPQCP